MGEDRRLRRLGWRKGVSGGDRQRVRARVSGEECVGACDREFFGCEDWWRLMVCKCVREFTWKGRSCTVMCGSGLDR